MKKNDPITELTSAQIEYIEKERLQYFEIRVIQFMILILFIALWQLGVEFEVINDFIFSSPSRICKCIYHLIKDGSLFIHTGITLFETSISFFLVTFFSLFIAIVLWGSKKTARILDPYLVILNSLPKSAMAPILIVWLGNHMKTIIVSAISVAIFGAILTLYTGFSQIDSGKIKLIYSLGGSKKDVLTKVLIPGSIPLVISTMKVNIGLCLIGVIIGEFLAAKKGLGYLIIYGSQVFELDLVMVSIVILCMISALLYKIISGFEKHVSI